MPSSHTADPAILYFTGVQQKDVFLQESGQTQLGRQLLKHQLLLFGRIARAPQDDPLRRLTFVPGSTEAATGEYIRRVGRPRNEWAVMVQRECRRMNLEFAKLINNELGYALLLGLEVSRILVILA